MKKLILPILILTISIAAQAQSERYVAAMERALTSLDSAKTIADFQTTANMFDRIAKADTTEWFAPYYQSLTYIIMASMSMQEAPDDLPLYVEEAQKAVEMCMRLAPESSEVHTMQGYAYMAHIWVNPMVNGAVYSGKSNASFTTAKELDPGNPRPHYLIGVNLFYTPEMWGGGKANAQPHLEKAAELYATFEPESELHPDWGEEFNAYFLEECKKVDMEELDEEAPDVEDGGGN